MRTGESKGWGDKVGIVGKKLSLASPQTIGCEARPLKREYLPPASNKGDVE